MATKNKIPSPSDYGISDEISDNDSVVPSPSDYGVADDKSVKKKEVSASGAASMFGLKTAPLGSVAPSTSGKEEKTEEAAEQIKMPEPTSAPTQEVVGVDELSGQQKTYKQPAFDPIVATKEAIKSTAQQWNNKQNIISAGMSSMDAYKKQYEDETLSPEVRNRAAENYNKTIEEIEKAQIEFEQIKKKATELQLRKKALEKPGEIREEHKKKEFDAADIGLGLMAGSDKLASSLLRTPEFLYDLAAIPQNLVAQYTGLDVGTSSQQFGKTVGIENKPAQYYEDAYKQTKAKIEEKYDKGISDYIANGDYAKAAALTAIGIAESAPVSMSLAIGNAAGVGAIGSTLAGGAVFGADKMREINEKYPDMPEADKASLAFSTGLLEGFFEQFGITKLGGIAKGVVEKMGKEAAKDVIEKSFKEAYMPMAKKYLGVMAEESISEAATQFAQNALDKYSGYNPGQELSSGVVDAAILGLASSKVMSLPTLSSEVYIESKNRGKAKELIDRQNAIREDLKNLELLPEVKQALIKSSQDINGQLSDLMVEDNKKYNALPQEDKDVVDRKKAELDNIEKSILTEGISEESKKGLEDSKAAVEEEIKNILNKPVSDEKKSIEQQEGKEEREVETKAEEKAEQVGEDIKPEVVLEKEAQLIKTEQDATKKGEIQEGVPTEPKEVVGGEQAAQAGVGDIVQPTEAKQAEEVKPEAAKLAISNMSSLINKETKLIDSDKVDDFRLEVRKLGRAYIESGVTDATELSKKIINDLSPFVSKELLDNNLEGILGEMRGFSKSVNKSGLYEDVTAEKLMAEESRYVPQKLSDVKDMTDVEKVEQMSDLEKLKAMGDKEGGNFSVLAGIDLMNEAYDKGDKSAFDNAYKLLTQSGTTVGQLLRQFGELKRSRPEGIVSIVEKSLTDLGKKITDSARKRLTQTADAHLKASREYNDFKKKLKDTDFSPEDLKELKRLEKAAKDAEQNLFTDINSLVPKSWSNLLGTGLKGNLLTALSVSRNITYNYLKDALDITAKLPAFAVDFVSSAITGKERNIFLDKGYFKEYSKGKAEGFKKGVSQLLTGSGTERMTRAELSSGFQPITAIKNLIKSDMMAVDEDGNVTLSDKAKKLYEGTFGANAEMMFRLLSFGDKVKSEAVYRSSLYEIGRGKKLKGEALQRFIEMPDEASMKKATERALFSTFQNEGWAAKTAQGAISSIKKSAENTRLGGVVKIFMDSVAPYVKTPTNILSQTLDYAVAPISAAKAVSYAKKGDMRMAHIMVGRFVVSMMLTALAKDLFDKEIITGNVKVPGKEKEDALSKSTGGVPGGAINVDAMKRYFEGGDPQRLPTDTFTPLSSIGMAGGIFTIHANLYEKLRRKGEKEARHSIKDGKVAENPLEKGFLKQVIDWGQLGAETVESLLEQSFLKGSNELLSAASKGEWDRWIANMSNTVSGIVIPNNMAAINRASREFKPRIKDDDLATWIGNNIKAKTFNYFGLGDKLYSNRGLFGEEIKETPDGKNPVVYHFMDVVRSTKPNNVLYKTIQDLYKNTGDAAVFPNYPDNSIKVGKIDVELSPEQYDEYLKMVGDERLKLISKYSKKIYNENIDEESRIRFLSNLYNLGARVAEANFEKKYIDKKRR